MNPSFDSINKPSLSLCMIVRNEQQHLPRCLASAQPYVDEIIVVDTGSEDETINIAMQYGAKVSYFSWCDDFAAARNYALSQASNDWILVLDADEELVVKSQEFRDQLGLKSEFAYLLVLVEVSHESKLTETPILRLFRNLPELRYISRFHEHLAYQNQPITHNQAVLLEDVKILHYGYGKEVVQQKTVNRIPILERMRQEGELSLMLLICLADMYETAQQVEKAQQCYAEAFDRLLPNLTSGDLPEQSGYVPFLLFKVGWQLLEQEDYETVRLVCQQGLKWFPQFPPLNYLTGLTLLVLGFPKGAVAYFEHCLQLAREGSYNKREPFKVDFMTTHPAFSLGCAYVELKHWQEAADAFNLALSFDPNHAPAQERLESIRQLLPQL